MWQSLLRHENVQSKVLVEPQKLLGSALWTCRASGHLGPTPSLCLSTWDGEGGKGGSQLLLELAPLIAGPVARGLADVLKLTHTRGHGSSEDPFQILLPLSLARPLWPAGHFQASFICGAPYRVPALQILLRGVPAAGRASQVPHSCSSPTRPAVKDTEAPWGRGRGTGARASPQSLLSIPPLCSADFSGKMYVPIYHFNHF